MDYKTERLILSLAAQENKPYNSSVHEMYIAFVCGEREAWDLSTGEIFNPDDFTAKNGDPKELSESTINNVLNKPSNKLLIEHALMGYTTFMHEQMPHVHRHNGKFSLSQITMDDVDLTRKLKDTRQRVHAYYAYDVVSQCVVGASYGRKKDQMLVVDCFRDMFRLIERNGWGIPAGIEVENHLMSEYKEGFLQAGVAFNFVHFCAPQNSQEKYAEPLNGAKKRNVCLNLMQKLGIDTSDWARINDFCRQPRIAGKPFARITTEELEQLAVKLRSIQRKGGLKPKRPSAPASRTEVGYMLMNFGQGGEA